MTISSRTLAGFALLALVDGCGGAASVDEVQLAADGTQAMMSSQQSTSLANVAFESITRVDPVAAAAQVVGSTMALWPSGCATFTKDPTNPHVAHVVYEDCTGPFGLVHLDGEVVMTFSADPAGGLQTNLVGVSLSADGHPITYAATAEIAISGATRRVVWQGSWTHADALGTRVAHTSDLNLDVDVGAGCRTANGTAKTMVDGREVDTTISDYEVCRNADGEEACPSGTVTHTGRLSGRSVTIKLDTSDTAEVTGPLGHTFAEPLQCPAGDTETGA